MLGLVRSVLEPTYTLGRSVIQIAAESWYRSIVIVGSQHTSLVVRSFFDFRCPDWRGRCLSQRTSWVARPFTALSNPCFGRSFWGSQHTSWVVRSFLEFRCSDWRERFWGANTQVGSFGRSSRCRFLVFGRSFWEPTYMLGRSNRFRILVLGDRFWSQHTCWVVQIVFESLYWGDRFRSQPTCWVVQVVLESLYLR